MPSLPANGIKCICCGNCCRERAIDITLSDILRWNKEHRWDILNEVYLIDNYPIKGSFGFYFEKSLKKKNLVRHCPFLTDNLCSIHDTKPSGCKDAPMAYDTFYECPVFERQDKSVIMFYKDKQNKDINAARINKNIIVGILVKAREWLK